MKKIKKALAKYWGYKSFRPLQEQAMTSLKDQRDSVVVLPTGGGKSLCYQAPAVTMDGIAIIVSPLISLMKDQVDGLNECGVPAARLDSTLSMQEQNHVLEQVRNNQLKLLYLSPERLVNPATLALLENTNLSFIAVDEAHCVSMWGHDFRPEYRQLGMLKKRFNNIPVAAYTATATQQVRQDIADQLNLSNPDFLVGSFDRPNLIYKVQPRKTIINQVISVIKRHKNESGIIYCIRRKDVEDICSQLESKGYRCVPYHAGMDDQDRKDNQDRFIKEDVDIVVATVAFGMGIDKSNVRYVIHTGMPKSLEHYQQESGRGGRDGLEAECCLFYSGGDYGIWKSLMSDMPGKAYDIALEKLGVMYNFCTGGNCRHQAILRYFGQSLEASSCNACDICMGEFDTVDNALIIAQKILSCIARVQQRFGSGYIASVLTGSREKRILENNHDMVSTYGLLSDYSASVVRDWIEQLVGQDFIKKFGDYNVLRITDKGVALLREEITPRLLKPIESNKKSSASSKAKSKSWEGVDRGLFDELRSLRSSLALSKGIPAYLIFGDAALRDMARLRPVTKEAFLDVKGVGAQKSKFYGKQFMAVIKEYCRNNTLDED